MAKLERISCPLCNKSEEKHVLKKNEFNIVQCKNCQLVYVNPRLNEKETAKLYNSDTISPVEYYKENKKGRIRKFSSDYLAYTLIDAIVDNYFIILEKIGDEIEYIEEKLTKNSSHHILTSIHKLKPQLLFIRKSVWPLRELISALLREDSKIISKSSFVTSI